MVTGARVSNGTPGKLTNSLMFHVKHGDQQNGGQWEGQRRFGLPYEAPHRTIAKNKAREAEQ
jgi:hypothetical protein